MQRHECITESEIKNTEVCNPFMASVRHENLMLFIVFGFLATLLFLFSLIDATFQATVISPRQAPGLHQTSSNPSCDGRDSIEK